MFRANWGKNINCLSDALASSPAKADDGEKEETNKFISEQCH